MSGVYHVGGTEQITITGPAKVDVVSDDAPVKSALPVPTLTAIAPNTAAKGTPDQIIQLTGTNFTPASDVLINGAKVTPIYVSSTTLRAQMPIKNVTAAGTATVAVRSGSQTTAPQTFTYT